jgi:hypothetical protein
MTVIFQMITGLGDLVADLHPAPEPEPVVPQ